MQSHTGIYESLPWRACNRRISAGSTLGNRKKSEHDCAAPAAGLSRLIYLVRRIATRNLVYATNRQLQPLKPHYYPTVDGIVIN